jgi:hypothetical protein
MESILDGKIGAATVFGAKSERIALTPVSPGAIIRVPRFTKSVH